jgi:hypothetical protein
MFSASAIQQLFLQNAIISGSTIGAQMALSLNVLNAQTSEQIEDALQVAREIADEHNFYLPEPDLTNGYAVDEYREMTVPYFTHQMRPIFNEAVECVADCREVAGGVVTEGIVLPLLPDIVRSGLVTFEAADGLLGSLEKELLTGMDALPTALSSENPHFKVPSMIGRFVANISVLGAGLLVFENNWLAVWVMLGAAPAIEVASYFGGRRVRFLRIEANRERAAALDSYRNSLENLKTLRARMTEIRDHIPDEVAPPKPTTPALRKALLRVKQGERNGWIDIVTGLPSLDAHAESTIKYFAAEMAEGRGSEIRILSPNLIHPLAYIAGDKLIGAGYLAYRRDGIDRPRLVIDGNSTTYPTQEDSVKDTIPSMLAKKRGLRAVKEALEEALGDGVDVKIVNNVYSA